METRFLLRKAAGDELLPGEAEVRGCLEGGRCLPSDFLFDFSTKAWCRVGDHPCVAALFGGRPAGPLERRMIYFQAPGAAAPCGPFSIKEIQQRAEKRELCGSSWVFVDGDKEWRQVRGVKALLDMLPPLPSDQPEPPAAAPPEAPPRLAPAENPALELTLDLGMAPEPPAAEAPAAGDAPPPAPVLSFAAEAPVVAIPEPGAQTSPSITIDLSGEEISPPPAPPPVAAAPATLPRPLAPPPPAAMAVPRSPMPAAGSAAPALAFEATVAPSSEGGEPEREDPTMALDTLGLALSSAAVPPAPAAPSSAPAPKARPASSPLPSMPSAPPRPPMPGPAPGPAAGPPPAGAGRTHDPDSFDGIVAEIPSDPIWLVKPAGSENVSGPFRFLDVIKFLGEGKLTKYDKISRVGTKSFVKILQQYEFNVKYNIETVVERGVEKQKILIKRRHPRVPYMTGVQVLSKQGMLAGNCINISAGGILMEVPKAEFNLGEILEVKVLPGLIPRAVSCKALVIGKIPKIPPGYALKFEDLKNEDKEAIEFYVQETLKREASKKT